MTLLLCSAVVLQMLWFYAIRVCTPLIQMLESLTGTILLGCTTSKTFTCHNNAVSSNNAVTTVCLWWWKISCILQVWFADLRCLPLVIESVWTMVTQAL